MVKIEEKVIELDAFVLPTTSGYVAYCEENVDKICKRFEEELYKKFENPEELKLKVKVNVYSPKKLREWDYLNIEDSFYKNLCEYTGALEHFKSRLNKWFKYIAFPLDTACFGGMIAEDLLRETYIKSLSYIAISSSVFFWGAFIFLPSTIIPGICSLRHRKKVDRAEKFWNSIKEINFVEGESERKKEMVRMSREPFLKIYEKDKPKYKHCEEMDVYLKKHGYNISFYSEMIKDIKSRESHFTLNLPESYKRKVKNLIKTFLVPAPKCVNSNLGWLGDKV